MFCKITYSMLTNFSNEKSTNHLRDFYFGLIELFWLSFDLFLMYLNLISNEVREPTYLLYGFN